MTNIRKIRSLICLAGDIDEMIFTNENKGNEQTQIHSER